MSYDIKPLLEAWPYRPDSVRARVIVGDDGEQYIQLRLDVGMLQMRLAGRPDGETPRGRESWLAHLQGEIEHLRSETGSDYGWRVEEKLHGHIDREIVQYYHRRVAFFALRDYRRAAEDATHNLEMMDLIRKYSDDPAFVAVHERWRPFVTMERARARALEALMTEDHPRALEHLQWAREAIAAFYRGRGLEQAIASSGEIAFLDEWAESIRTKYAAPPTLEEQLSEAVEREQYEQAADLRDRIHKLRSEEGIDGH